MALIPACLLHSCSARCQWTLHTNSRFSSSMILAIRFTGGGTYCKHSHYGYHNNVEATYIVWFSLDLTRSFSGYLICGMRGLSHPTFIFFLFPPKENGDCGTSYIAVSLYLLVLTIEESCNLLQYTLQVEVRFLTYLSRRPTCLSSTQVFTLECRLLQLEQCLHMFTLLSPSGGTRKKY